MSENKIGKYLKYALGEIVLVVIGILIALSINSWNESKIFMTKVNEQLKMISKDLDYDIDMLNQKQQAITTITERLKELSSTEHDSIDLDLVRFVSVDPGEIKFNDPYSILYDNNGLNSISELTLLEELNRYYNISRPTFISQFKDHKTTVKQFIEEQVNSVLVFDTKGNLVREKMLPLIKEKNIKSTLMLQLGYFRGDLFVVNKTIKQAEELKKKLDNYLYE